MSVRLQMNPKSSEQKQFDVSRTVGDDSGSAALTA